MTTSIARATRGAALAAALLIHSTGGLSVAAEPVDAIAQWGLSPFWEGREMRGESLFFLEAEAGCPPASRLLFTPETILELRHPATGALYEEGRDFTVDRATRTLTLTADSRIPRTTRAEFEPPLDATGQRFRDNTRDIFFAPGPLFHNLQVEATYTHGGTEWAAMEGPVPAPAADLLPGFSAKLAAGAPVTVCLLGDSISFGLDASGVVNAPPHMPGYGSLFALGLTSRFGSPVDFTNFSISGMSTPWGIEQAAAVAGKKPDLVVIAFGMNDASGRMAPGDFAGNISKIMAGIQGAHPAVEFILVSTMRGNADWIHAAPELYPQYREALVALQGPGVAVADLTSVWSIFLDRKSFADVTGNGVNHPNDFGHRVYAQVLLALFPKSGAQDGHGG